MAHKWTWSMPGALGQGLETCARACVAAKNWAGCGQQDLIVLPVDTLFLFVFARYEAD